MTSSIFTTSEAEAVREAIRRDHRSPGYISVPAVLIYLVRPARTRLLQAGRTAATKIRQLPDAKAKDDAIISAYWL